ncbi:MAG: hypothetical protein FWE85_02670 [Clostridiales bacterium]|nr:hypothetical protein [Clostridiales bacterium]
MKKLLFIILSALLIFCLAACGKGPVENPNDDPVEDPNDPWATEEYVETGVTGMEAQILAQIAEARVLVGELRVLADDIREQVEFWLQENGDDDDPGDDCDPDDDDDPDDPDDPEELLDE